ncbi:hypothetical protein BACCOP_02066 [Phocaeicola coprocola DSM 17136]|uniref:Uncharacterized protein n=1 Tax=Phocaeicola coprocola DSM 17136 TaxID=470145 RepID=B3JJJ6_9BACT|nr:hypothetical protein BACCOP_02066 [Phocaeicola coprocola DSM 17136]
MTIFYKRYFVFCQEIVSLLNPYNLMAEKIGRYKYSEILDLH